MAYYNSIQDGACCRRCFSRTITLAKASGELIALSEEYRINSSMIISKVIDHLDGIHDPIIDDEYVDRMIIKVTDQEIIIISNNADPVYCLGGGYGIAHIA